MLWFKFPILKSCLTNITISVHYSLVSWMKSTGDTTQKQSCSYMQRIDTSLPPTVVTCSGLVFGTITCSLTPTYNASISIVFPYILIMSSRDHQQHCDGFLKSPHWATSVVFTTFYRIYLIFFLMSYIISQCSDTPSDLDRNKFQRSDT